MKITAPNGEFRQTSANCSPRHVLLSAPKPEDVQTTTKNLVKYILYGKLALLLIQYGSTKAIMVMNILVRMEAHGQLFPWN